MDDVTRVAETLLDAYESQLRALVPLELPWGAVVERDGPLVRTHYGTHATVHHAALRDDLAGLIRRQQELFAARCEPVEWKVYSHDAPLLGESLRAAGFVPGPERALLMADIAKVPSPEDLPPGMRIRPHLPGERERLRRRAAVVPEQRRPLSELEADGTARGTGSEMEILLLEYDGRILDAVWIERVGGTDFAAIGGITGPRRELLQAAAAWAEWRGVRQVFRHRTPRHLVAEAPGSLVPAYAATGFHAIAQVSTYRWAPAGEPARDRPAKQLLSDPEHDKIWKRFETRFEVTYETAARGITEPPASATWHLDAVEHPDDPLLAEVETIIERGLRASARPGDRLYRLKWYVSGSRIDPTRVGGPGQPRWTSYAYLVDEHVIQVTEDLRMGTFGNWWEASLCVFGQELLTHVDEELTELLGTVLRRGGRPVGNVWSFGP
ncbi:DUF2716 domain-containing protein [Nonomuraea muscovyensis]